MSRRGLPCAAGALFLLACTEQPAAMASPGGVRGAALAGSGAPAAAGQAAPSADAAAGSPAPLVPAAPLDSGIAGSMPPPPADAGPPRTTRIHLVDHSLWTLLGPEEDPFADRPADTACASDAAGPEWLGGEYAYGVETGECSYITARQLTQYSVAAGETVIVRLWHFALDAPNPGEAHVVVAIDGLPLLDERIPIPAPGGLIKVEVPLGRALPMGSPVHFHLHNHGANSWALVEISAGP